MKDVFELQTWIDKFGEENLNLDKLKEYLEFVQEAERSRDPERYSEWHHVMPKCLDKEKEYVKYVHLNGADHFRAHMMLVECFVVYKPSWRSMCFALTKLLGTKGYELSPEEYEEVRHLNQLALKGREVSEETRKRLSLARQSYKMTSETGRKISKSKQGHCSGESNSFYGKSHSEETKSQISKSKVGKVYYHKDRVNIVIDESQGIPDGYVKGKYWSEESLSQLRESHLKGNLSDETLRKLSESRKGPNNPMYGKTLSEETKDKISTKLKGSNNPMYGKSHTEETLNKISETLSDGRLKGSNNPMYGKVRITDGVHNKTINKEDEVPKGWRYGMSCSRKKLEKEVVVL